MICLVAADHPGFVVDSFSQGKMLAIMRMVTVVGREKEMTFVLVLHILMVGIIITYVGSLLKIVLVVVAVVMVVPVASGSSGKTLSRSAFGYHLASLF